MSRKLIVPLTLIRGNIFDQFIRRAALAGLFALTTSAAKKLVVMAALVAICAMPSSATTPCTTVTSTDDSFSAATTAGTLRYAVAQANVGTCDTINFSLTYPTTITLAQGQLEISNSTTPITISGPGAVDMAISGNNATRVLQVNSGVMLSIRGMTIENGNCGGSQGNPCIPNASGANGGGGIHNLGALTVTNSTFSGNSAGSDRLSSGGGIYNDYFATATVINSIFSGNSANYQGGGINNDYRATSVVTNSTFSGNSAYYGAGIFNWYAILMVKSTLLANGASGGNCYNTGTFNSAGYNLSDDGSCGFTQTGDLNNTAAGLDPNGLQNNGGPTQTIALLATSPAVDAILVSTCTDVAGNPVTTDQRGVTRPQGSACDIGAFELTPPAPPCFPDLTQSNGTSMIPPAPLVSSTGSLSLFDSASWSNGYGSFNRIGNHMYHTGLDIQGKRGETVITSAAPGTVKLLVGLTLQPDKVSVNQPESIYVWDDLNGNSVPEANEIINIGDTGRQNQNHGVGIAIVIDHGNNVATLYGHLYAVRKEIYQALVVNGRSCSVGQGQPIAVLGASVYADWKNGTTPHVHFEVKEKPLLESPRSDLNDKTPAPYWGYTPDHPDGYGYSDPFLAFTPPPVPTATSVAIKVIDEESAVKAINNTKDRGIRVYSGPGVKYSVLGWTGLGVTLVANTSVLSTTPGDEQNNRLWYQISFPHRLGTVRGWVASAKKDGTPLVQIDPSAALVTVTNDGGIGWRLRLDPAKECDPKSSDGCIRVWDNVYNKGVYRRVRAWNGLRLARFAVQQVSGTTWSGVYIPKFYFMDPVKASESPDPHDNVVGEITTVWLSQDAVPVP